MEFILWILEKGHLEIIRKSWYGLIFFTELSIIKVGTEMFSM